MAKELSGPAWVERFPGSQSPADLADDFRPNCEAFLAALQSAGASVDISATFRPRERAYLMHHSFLIGENQEEPQDVEAMPGVEIEWVHRRADGTPDLTASRAAATAMVNGYDIAFKPALKTLHAVGQAIDMSISWSGTLKIKQKDGTEKSITGSPRDGDNQQLWAVGKTYDVIKNPADHPHWSINGR